jgi:beta-N-acetylhexosaminidase
VLAALAGVDTILFSHTAVVQQAAYDGLLRAAESGRIPAANMTAALERIARLKAAVAVDAPPDLTAIRTPDHLATVQEAARAGVVHVSGVLPHPVPARTVVVEFVSYLESGIVEVGGQTGLAQRVAERLPAAHTVSLPSIEPPPDQVADLIARAAAADLLIVATRSAAWNPEQAELAGALMRSARATVLLALRTPFDAALFPQADAVLAACGDSAPSLDAVLAALMGDFTPTGRLPVALDDPRAVDGAAS